LRPSQAAVEAIALQIGRQNDQAGMSSAPITACVAMNKQSFVAA